VGADLDEWNSSLANCYGYANNKKAFCLPGQGALIDPTVRGVQALLRSYDQLCLVAMGDPSRPPRARRQAAYIAVCLRGPVGNQFSSLHCFRMDRSGAWSDKDGSFPVEDRATPTLHSIRTSPRLTLVGVFLSEEGRRQID
jgi:hypothetical protein